MTTPTAPVLHTAVDVVALRTLRAVEGAGISGTPRAVLHTLAYLGAALAPLYQIEPWARDFHLTPTGVTHPEFERALDRLLALGFAERCDGLGAGWLTADALGLSKAGFSAAETLDPKPQGDGARTGLYALLLETASAISRLDPTTRPHIAAIVGRRDGTLRMHTFRTPEIADVVLPPPDESETYQITRRLREAVPHLPLKNFQLVHLYISFLRRDEIRGPVPAPRQTQTAGD